MIRKFLILFAACAMAEAAIESLNSTQGEKIFKAELPNVHDIGFSAESEVFCTFKRELAITTKMLDSCMFNKQSVDSDDIVLGSPINATVKRFSIYQNEKVKFLPRLIGKKLPNLTEIHASFCGLKTVRDYFFKDMQNLEVLILSSNEISTIEPDAFRDLVYLKWLSLNYNFIQTIDKKIFATMVNLEDLDLKGNKIKFLTPITFEASGVKPFSVDLKENICIDKLYLPKEIASLDKDIKANCTQQ